MQSGAHLDHTLDPECQDGMKTDSCLTLRSSIVLFMPDLCIEVKKCIVVDSVALQKNSFV